MERNIVTALVVTAGTMLALSLAAFLALLIHEIGTFCDDIMDPFQSKREKGGN